MKKLKTYRLSISSVFPATHTRKGEETQFYSKIKNAVENRIGMNTYDKNGDEVFVSEKKFHTCRASYDLWKKRIDEVNAGKAILVVFEWVGVPYRSKQRALFTFGNNSGIGIQHLEFRKDRDRAVFWNHPLINGVDKNTELSNLAHNDGLSLQDFKDWFKGYDTSKPMAIIQFTNFRY